MPDDPNQDEIIREVRAIREAYAARFNYDVGAIFRDAKERERQSDRPVVALEPKRIPVEAASARRAV